MTKTKEPTVVDVLFKDEPPEMPYEVMMLSLLFYPEVHSELVAAVIEEIGESVMEYRLEQKMLQWVPTVLVSFQENDWQPAIDTWTDVVLCARERFPSVAELFTIEELALAWERANTVAGQKAVEYIRGGESMWRQPQEMILRSTLLSGVSHRDIGEPSRETRRKVLKEVRIKHCEAGYRPQALLEHREAMLEQYRKLNQALRPHLRRLRLEQQAA